MERMKTTHIPFAAAALALALVAGCASSQQYLPPSTPLTAGYNVKELDKSRDQAWDSTLPELGKRFFVINNIERSSGFINLSYSGEPERYIDCGEIHSTVVNLRGKRTYEFPAAKARQVYEVLRRDIGLVVVDRRMSLEGRINLIFEDIGPNRSRVTATTRYGVTRTRIFNLGSASFPQRHDESIFFDSLGAGDFPRDKLETTTCVPTGALERAVLEAVN